MHDDWPKFPTAEELDIGCAEQAHADRMREMRHTPGVIMMTDAEAELRASGRRLPDVVQPMDVEPMTPLVDVSAEPPPEEPEPPKYELALPVPIPIVWCDWPDCGEKFSYGPDRFGKARATTQMKRHRIRAHGAGYDTRGKNPQQRAKRIGKGMRTSWRSGAHKRAKDHGQRPTDVPPTDE